MTSDADRQRAAELFAEARRLHENYEYYEARERYDESLKLYEDPEVEAWYHRLLATIGPL